MSIKFHRGRDPKSIMGIGDEAWRAEEYLWKKYPYPSPEYENVHYLETPPLDPKGNHKYRAVIYQGGPWGPHSSWSLSVEDFAGSGRGWQQTPGTWSLDAMLGDDGTGRMKGDIAHIQGARPDPSDPSRTPPP